MLNFHLHLWHSFYLNVYTLISGEKKGARFQGRREEQCSIGWLIARFSFNKSHPLLNVRPRSFSNPRGKGINLIHREKKENKKTQRVRHDIHMCNPKYPEYTRDPLKCSAHSTFYYNWCRCMVKNDTLPSCFIDETYQSFIFCQPFNFCAYFNLVFHHFLVINNFSVQTQYYSVLWKQWKCIHAALDSVGWPSVDSDYRAKQCYKINVQTELPDLSSPSPLPYHHFSFFSTNI